MFWSKNKKNRYTTAYPIFAILKWGMRGYTFQGHVFLMLSMSLLASNIIIINLGPVVQNFVSLTLSLSPQFVNYISTSKANTL